MPKILCFSHSTVNEIFFFNWTVCQINVMMSWLGFPWALVNTDRYFLQSNQMFNLENNWQISCQ